MTARTLLLMAAGCLLSLAGCAINPDVQPLMPDQFVRNRQALGPNPVANPVEQSGGLVYGQLHAPLLPDDPQYNARAHPPVGVSPLVRAAVPAPGRGAGAQVNVATRSASARVEPSSGQDSAAAPGFEWVGTILVQVSGKTIYADQVLASIERQLAADAHKYDDPQQFREIARADIAARIDELIHSDLEVTAAEKYLNREAKAHAELYAQIWRQQQIAAAGGSEALARQRAIEAGTTLDELVKAQYEKTLVQLDYQQRITPKIHITASDIRRYYQQHVDSEFTQHAQARFRLIMFDAEDSGSYARAVEKMDRVLRRLKGGADFSTLAGEQNDDPDLMKQHGDVGWVQKGAWRNEDVERAVWALQPGQYTDHPIEDRERSRLYIAKLDARKPGAIRPFDDPDVQSSIKDTLFNQQFAILREQRISELIQAAVVVRNPQGLEIAVEMAMQRYPLWASAR